MIDKTEADKIPYKLEQKGVKNKFTNTNSNTQSYNIHDCWTTKSMSLK